MLSARFCAVTHLTSSQIAWYHVLILSEDTWLEYLTLQQAARKSQSLQELRPKSLTVKIVISMHDFSWTLAKNK